MKKKSKAELRYLRHLGRQQDMLDRFAEDESMNSELLLMLYRQKGRDMPDDIYRAVVFFRNEEYKRKQGAWALLCLLYEKLKYDMGARTKEEAVDAVCYRYQVYGQALLEGDF
jgi:hypothetical protein